MDIESKRIDYEAAWGYARHPMLTLLTVSSVATVSL